MDDLAEMVDHNGQCVVENFTIGRKGNDPSNKMMYAPSMCLVDILVFVSTPVSKMKSHFTTLL